MRRAAAIALLAAMTLPAAGEPERQQPYELVRTLQAVQNRGAFGDQDAYRSLPGLVTGIAAKLSAADPESWRESKNARAAVIFVLSGGPARMLRRVLDLGTAPKADEKLMRGALAYVEGHETEARQFWAGIDARNLEPSVGGPIALAQAALALQEDKRKALALLDTARLLMPGTLIEEAAMRRKIFLLDESDAATFLTLSSQYARRYGRSVFAENFKQRFAAAAAKLAPGADGQQFRRIDAVVAEFGQDEQRDVQLLIARAALLGGKIAAARSAAERVGQLAVPGSAVAMRAALYGAAAMTLTNDFDKGLSALEALDPAALTGDDTELRDAAIQVAKEIRAWPTMPANAAATEPPAGDGDGDGPARPTPAMRLAEDAIAAADRALARALP